MYSDYHVHSNFSFDSDETFDNIINRAIALNMKQICITDHQDYNWPVDGELPYVDFVKYNETFDLYKNKYSNKINLLKGIELGLAPENAAQCKSLLANEHFDFVIGSCHIVDGMDPYYSQFWENKSDRDAFEAYFDGILNGLKTFDQIDTLGHMDYIVRYSPNKDSNYSPSDYTDKIDEILKFIINKNIKLEINTSNYSKQMDFPNPHLDIISRYAELGGTHVTVGSDAHNANAIGQYFDKVSSIVDKFNLKIYTV